MVPSTSIPEFQALLASVHAKNGRVMALYGAGLSAASGLGTFRGAGVMWKRYNAVELATPKAFAADPGLVASHPEHRIHPPSSNSSTDFSPTSPASIPVVTSSTTTTPTPSTPCSPSPTTTRKRSSPKPASPLTTTNPSPSAPRTSPSTPNSYPSVPLAKKSILRPGVVWFSEPLPKTTIASIDAWISSSKKIDIMLVIGTTAQVHPAAGYVNVARKRGARIVVVNMEGKDEDLGAAGGLRNGDFLFQGDAGMIVPEILRGVVGEVSGE